MADPAADAPVEISLPLFSHRIRDLFDAWNSDDVKENETPWKNSDVFLVLTGKVEDDDPKTKSEKFHVWLFGLLFPEVIILLERKSKTISFIARAKKLKYFEKLKSSSAADSVNFAFTELPSPNVPAHYNLLEQFLSPAVVIAQGQSNRISISTLLGKAEILTGTFAEEVKKYLKWPDAPQLQTELSSPFRDLELTWLAADKYMARLLLIHDDAGLENEKKSAVLASRILKEVLLTRIVEILDKEEVETHTSIANRAEQALNDQTRLNKWESKYGLLPQAIDVGNALVQSGGAYDLKASAETTDQPLCLSGGAIIVSCTSRYNFHFASIARTLLLDPFPGEKEAYSALLDVYETVCAQAKPSVSFNSLHKIATDLIRDKYSKYEHYVVKSLGNAMGLSFKEVGFNITAGAPEEPLRENMVLNFSLGFQNLPVSSADNKKKRVVSVWLADTVQITANAPVFLGQCTRVLGDIVYEIAEADKGPKEAPRGSKQRKQASREDQHDDGPSARSDRIKARRRGAQVNVAEAERVLRVQRQLRIKKFEELTARFGSGGGLGASDSKKSVIKLSQMAAYRDPSEFPRNLRPGKIFVDMIKDAILLPVGGVHIPVHISAVRNALVQEEDGCSAFRLSFQVPGSQSLTKGSEPSPLPDLTRDDNLFIKELIFKTKDPAITVLCKQVKDLIKKVRTRGETGDTEEAITQQPLQLNRTNKRNVLRNLMVRHSAGHSKRIVGTLEAHLNGLRYQAPRHETVDILYKNVKHAFFQPVASDLIVLLHFELISPILINKKKVGSIQFYTEAGSQTDDLDRRRIGYDPDEIAEEQREQQLKKRLNTEFKRFVESVQEIGGIDVEMPHRALGFYGVPRNSSVFVMPTRSCLVALSEWPVFVLTIADVEIASLERVMHGLRNFDIVFVPKDYSKSVTNVTTVPIESIDVLKTWMNEVEMVWYEVKTNLNWAGLLKTIRSDIAAFLDEGGFASFLGDEQDDKLRAKLKKKEANADESNGSEEETGGGDEDDSDEDDEDYKEEESESSGDDGEGDSSSSEASEGDESGSDVSEAEDEEEEEGLSWDELEKQAINEDRKRGHNTDDEEDDRPKKKKRVG